MEIWKDIQGYEGLYQVSNYGRVRSLDRYISYKGIGKALRKGKFLKPYQADNGYLRVILQKDGKINNFAVHALVMKMFVGEKQANMQINHKDECKTNNNVENLEYCSAKYNCNYGNRTEKIIQKRQKPVIGLNMDGEIVYEFKNAKEAENFGFSSSHICNCCKGKRKWHKGLFWKYDLRNRIC